MKPSDRILANIQRMGGTKDNAITAIIDFLDEEYEKKQNALSNAIDDLAGVPLEER